MNDKFGMLKAYQSFWKNYLNVKSTSNRSTYWWSLLWNWAIRLILVIWGLIMILRTGRKFNAGIVLFLVYSLAALIPSLSLIARRYQDAGISKWWMLFTYLLPCALYFTIRLITPTTLFSYLTQNTGAFLIFICATVAIILPMFPSRSKN